MLSEVRFEQRGWDLKDVLPSHRGPEFEGVLASIEAATKRLESLRPMLSNFTRNEVDEEMLWAEALTRNLGRVTSYAYMLFTSDTQDEGAKALLDRCEELRAAVTNRVLFLELYWIGVDDKTAAAILPANPDYAFYLQSLRKRKPHSLGEEAEQVINIKNTTGSAGWIYHYDQVTSGFTFELRPGGKVVVDEGGSPRKFLSSEVTRLYTSQDPEEREAAYKANLSKYRENGQALGEIYRTLVRDWRNENLTLRKYATPISPRNLENDVSDRAVQVLLDVCRSNAPLFQQFFTLKAKTLGMERMVRYHIYAPLPDEGKRYAFPDAASMVLAAYSEFDPQFGKLAFNIFDQDHIDSEERRGKQPGAYCMGVSPDVVPYIHLNYAGMLKDIYTLAHECGHGIHNQLSSNHSMLTYPPSLVMAETASVFGEMILFDKLMKSGEDPSVKKAMLMEKISSMYATIGRQSYFVIFENSAHRAVVDGSTTSELCSIYLANLREQFGAAVEVPEEFQWEWTMIPHIYHTPFYCYAYAFGNLLSLALYDRYLKEGRQFVPTYLKLLSYGSSATPDEMLGEVGVDISSAQFWQGGFDVIRRMVDDVSRI